MSFKLNDREIKVAIASAVFAVVASVIALDMYGYIRHSEAADGSVIGEFKLIHLAQNTETRISNRPANKEAFCVDGYLMMRPQKNETGNQVAGLLVDEKNRPILCSTDLPSPKNL